MKYLILIVAFTKLLVYQASAQNVPGMDINTFAAKHIEIREVRDHIGDTVCIYGHVRDLKVELEQNIIITQIDSALNSEPITAEVAYIYPEAKPYILKQLKNNTIILYGIVTGSHDKPKVVSKFFMEEDKESTWLSFFKQVKRMQRDTSKRSRTYITDVQLLPPNPATVKRESNKYISARLNKKIWYCDRVSGGKLSHDKTFIELYLSNSTLVILIKNNIRNKFKTAPQTAFLNKQICVKGTVIVYKGKFAVNITDPKQIELLPDPDLSTP